MSPSDETTVLNALTESKKDAKICIHTMNCLHAYCLGLLDIPNLIGLLEHLLADSDQDISSYGHSPRGKSRHTSLPRLKHNAHSKPISVMTNVLDCRKLVRNNKAVLLSHTTSTASVSIASPLTTASDPLLWDHTQVVAAFDELQKVGAAALILATADRKTWVSDLDKTVSSTAQETLALLGLCHLPTGIDAQNLELFQIEFNPSSFIDDLFRPCPVDGVNLRHRAFPLNETLPTPPSDARTFGMTVNLDSADLLDGKIELIHIPKDPLKQVELAPRAWEVAHLGKITQHATVKFDAEFAKALWERDEAKQLVQSSSMTDNVKTAYAELYL